MEIQGWVSVPLGLSIILVRKVSYSVILLFLNRKRRSGSTQNSDDECDNTPELTLIPAHVQSLDLTVGKPAMKDAHSVYQSLKITYSHDSISVVEAGMKCKNYTFFTEIFTERSSYAKCLSCPKTTKFLQDHHAKWSTLKL